ncbi:MAG TPA: hypothetical protein VJH94_01430 [Candidatus Paceibacterota bacterium]
MPESERRERTETEQALSPEVSVEAPEVEGDSYEKNAERAKAFTESGSAGLTPEEAQKRLAEMSDMALQQEFFDDASVTIPPSALGDHYIEFGNKGTREAGERQVSGLRIGLKI